MVAYTKDFGSHTDVGFVYSTDGGANWSGEFALPGGSTSTDEDYVDLSASNASGRFHAAIYRYTPPPTLLDHWKGEVLYTWTNVESPHAWASEIVVNEGSDANYNEVAVSVNPTRPLNEEACVAWNDHRLGISLPFPLPKIAYDVFNTPRDCRVDHST